MNPVLVTCPLAGLALIFHYTSVTCVLAHSQSVAILQQFIYQYDSVEIKKSLMDQFEAYLKCGFQAYGFLRLKCEGSCGEEWQLWGRMAVVGKNGSNGVSLAILPRRNECY